MRSLFTFLKLLRYDRESIPSIIFDKVTKRGLVNWLPDRAFLALKYFFKFHKKLDLKHPKSFNEKLQWLKLYNRNPLYTQLVDKYDVRNFVRDRVGEKYLVPLINVYEKVDEIEFDELPDKFVLKCTHDSGNVIICKDKKEFDLVSTKKSLGKILNKNFFYWGREWPYKNVKPRIICEEFLVDESGYELKDYKIYCYHGEPKIIQVMSNRSKGGYNLSLNTSEAETVGP